MSHIVRTCRAVVEDVEPKHLPSIPKGTYGIASDDDGGDFGPVDFGAPWGVQHVGNHNLVDAAAVLENAKRAVTLRRRPWRDVIRRTLKTFAGPYLVTAAAEKGELVAENEEGGGARWPVESYLNHYSSKRAALALLQRAKELAGGVAGSPPWLDPYRRDLYDAEAKPKPETVAEKSLWRVNGSVVHVREVIPATAGRSPPADDSYAVFFAGGRGLVAGMLAEEKWEYLGQGPEHDVFDPLAADRAAERAPRPLKPAPKARAATAPAPARTPVEEVERVIAAVAERFGLQPNALRAPHDHRNRQEDLHATQARHVAIYLCRKHPSEPRSRDIGIALKRSWNSLNNVVHIVESQLHTDPVLRAKVTDLARFLGLPQSVALPEGVT